MGKHSLTLALEVAVSQQEWTGLAFTFPRAGGFPLSPAPAQPQRAEKSQAPSAARETLTRSDPEHHHAAPIHPGLLQLQLPHFHSQEHRERIRLPGRAVAVPSQELGRRQRMQGGHCPVPLEFPARPGCRAQLSQASQPWCHLPPPRAEPLGSHHD